MKRKNNTSTYLVVGFIILFVIALIVLIFAVKYASYNKNHYLTPVLDKWEPDAPYTSSYQSTFRETALIYAAQLDIFYQASKDNLTDEQYDEFETQYALIMQRFLSESNEHKRITKDDLKDYNNLVTSVWGPHCVYALDEEKEDRNIHGWSDGIMFFSLRRTVLIEWLKGNVSDDDYLACMEKTDYENIDYANLSSKKVWELIEYMYVIIQ